MELGKRISALPTAQGARTDLTQPVDTPVEKLKPKSETIAEFGLTQKQAERFQQMAQNPKSLQVIADYNRQSYRQVHFAFVGQPAAKFR